MLEENATPRLAGVNGREFIRRSQRWAKDRDVDVVLDPTRGKGGHQLLRIGARWTTVQSGELKAGVYNAMLKQLGIPKEEF